MKNAKRYLAVALSFALFLALPLAFTQEAAAASKTKVAQLDKVITVSTNSANKTSTSVVAYAYDKKGLNTLRATQDNEGEIGNRHAYTYNKSGYLTSDTSLSKDNKPTAQTIYTVKKGKTTASASYTVTDSKVDLTSYTKTEYKNGKKSKVTTASADGKSQSVTTYKKGVISQYVYVSDNDVVKQIVTDYDKYGNVTSDTYMWKSGDVTKTVYKNTYKNGNLVKAAWTEAYSNSKETSTGLAVFTYKKGKLVKEVVAETYSGDPGVTEGRTTTYAYTKGGLIKTVANARTRTTAAETKVLSSSTRAFQYKNVAVDKKCVKAVKAAMEDYSYKNVLPSPFVYDYDFDYL